jgi:hypothetical protein
MEQANNQAPAKLIYAPVRGDKECNDNGQLKGKQKIGVKCIKRGNGGRLAGSADLN